MKNNSRLEAIGIIYADKIMRSGLKSHSLVIYAITKVPKSHTQPPKGELFLSANVCILEYF